MAEEYHGRIYTTREELGLPPLSEEKIAQANKAFADFKAYRDSVPPGKRKELSERFGEHDFDWPDEDDAQPVETSADKPGAVTQAPSTPEQHGSDADDSGGISFHI